MAAFLHETEAGVQISLRVTPKASRDEIVCPDADETRLRVKVTAVPEDGKANAAVIALLAKRLGMPKRAITITQGETARDKRLLIEGCSLPEILTRLKND
ncbi:MAG: DUF167 domain-containing protein [Candidatus Melainabacteria bacterium]